MGRRAPRPSRRDDRNDFSVPVLRHDDERGVPVCDDRNAARRRHFSLQVFAPRAYVGRAEDLRQADTPHGAAVCRRVRVRNRGAFVRGRDDCTGEHVDRHREHLGHRQVRIGNHGHGSPSGSHIPVPDSPYGTHPDRASRGRIPQVKEAPCDRRHIRIRFFTSSDGWYILSTDGGTHDSHL